MPRRMLPPEVIGFFHEHRGFYNMPLDPAEDGPGAGEAWLATSGPAPATDADDPIEP